MAGKPALGKGLGALLSGAERSEKISEEKPVSFSDKKPVQTDSEAGKPVNIKLESIKPNPHQPRREFDPKALDELAASIKEHGVLQPVVVMRLSPDSYQLIAGERRFRAARRAGLATIPAILRTVTELQSLELAIIENVQREDLNCIEEAMSYFSLAEDFGLNQEAIAKKVGKDRSTVTNTMRLLKLPHRVVQDLKKGELSLGHGKALLSLDDHEKVLQLRNRILDEDLSVRATEELARQLKTAPMGGSKKTSPTTSSWGVEWQEVRSKLEKSLDTRVIFKGRPKKGKIVIDFNSLNEFNRILDKIAPE